MSDLAYLSFLATDDFLPGVRVLAHSLRKTQPKAPLLVLVTDNVGTATRRELDRLGIATREIERIPLPVQRPTSLTFGGRDLTELYVTSASVGLDQEAIERGFHAGDLFRISTGSPGMPAHPFADG